MPSASRIAAQMYTLRDFTKTPADIAHTCARVKKIGFDAIQISAFGPIAPAEIAKILASEGLTCCATHVPFEILQKEPERIADEHRLWNCKHTAPGSLPASYGSRGAPGYRDFAHDATTLARKLHSLGLTLSYHNHAFEFEKFDGRLGLDIIYEDSDPTLLHAEIDTFWVQTGGADPAAWLHKLKGRIPLLHLKDMLFRNYKQIMAEVGEGNLNWPAILAAARAGGTEWYIIEQDVCERDPFESLTLSLRNLHALGVS